MPQSQVSVISSGLHAVRSVFDLMPTEGEEAWSNIGARLAAIPATLDGYRATLTQAADEGHVAAKRQLTSVAEQVRSWTGQEGGENFFLGLVARTDVDGLRGDLERHAQGASDAFAEFGRWLDSDLAPRGRDKDAVGRERYSLGSRYFLGATVDLEETYAWGFEELKRIEDEMARVADKVVPGGSLDDAVAALEADPARRIEGTENFREWMQDLATRTLDDMAGTHFDIPEPIRRIECCIAPTHDGGIYYTGPSEDFVRPGRMWWAVPEGVDSFATWREVTTVFHEGVPGHHLQVAQTAYRKEVLNRWQRLMCWVSGHGEGWALYAERLMDELGYLDDPGDKLGMLDGQGFRAARVVVDIGMHLELEIPRDNPFGFHPGETWTPDLGLEFMRQHCRMEDAFIRFEVNRYLGWPGQARPTRWASASGCRPARTPGPASAATSTCAPSTGPRSTSARSASTRCRRRWRASRDPAGPGQRVPGPARHPARRRPRPRGGGVRGRRVGGDHPRPRGAGVRARGRSRRGRWPRSSPAPSWSAATPCSRSTARSTASRATPRRPSPAGGRCAAGPGCCTPATA